MYRIHFTRDDLTKVRVGRTFGPLAETVFGLDALQRPAELPHVLRAWRRSVSSRLDGRLGLLRELMPRAYVFDLISTVGRTWSIDEAVAVWESTPRRIIETELVYTAAVHQRPPAWAHGLVERRPRLRRELGGAFRALHDVAVGPFWERTSSLLEAEYARLLRLLGEGGVDRLLANLHPGIRWRPPVLVVRSRVADGRDHWLRGTGLEVVPSLFCPDGYPVSHDSRDPALPHVLFYPARPDPAELRGLLQPEQCGQGSLVALLGRTRARVLGGVALGPCTTTELAARCHISVASASEHATVLRRAGLVHTQRHRQAVLHSVTPLGGQLLDRDGGL